MHATQLVSVCACDTPSLADALVLTLVYLSLVIPLPLQALSDTYDFGHKQNLKKSASTEPIASRQVAILM